MVCTVNSVGTAARFALWLVENSSPNQGDWYLPSIGELAFIMPNFNDLQTAISDVSGVQLGDNRNYWSSTEYGENK